MEKKRKRSELSLLSTANVFEEPTPGCYVKARYVLAIMGFLAKFGMYAMRTNLSVAIVAMVNSTATATLKNISHTCPDHGVLEERDADLNGIFNWNSAQQGLLLGCYFYGYILSNVPGGYLAKRFGVRVVVGVSMLLSSILTVLSPVIATSSFELFVAVRVLLGILQGVISPALHTAWGKWSPPLERSKLPSIPTSGGSLGTFAALPLAGIIAEHLGWEAVFYITGGASLPLSIVWLSIIHNSPGEHPRISEQEKSYIERSTGHRKKDPTVRVRTPWLSMIRSIPLWAIIIAHFAANWGNNTLMMMLPTYMSTILRFNLSSIGALSAIPYVLQFAVMLLGGLLSDVVRKKRLANTTTVRKGNSILGLVVPSIFIVLAGYIGCNVVIAVTFFAISVAFAGFNVPGAEANAVDIAPKYGGIIYGIANTIGNVSGFLAPQVIGLMLLDDGSLTQWRNVFWMTAGVYCASAAFYLIFASGVEQSWAGGKILAGQTTTSAEENKMHKPENCPGL